MTIIKENGDTEPSPVSRESNERIERNMKNFKTIIVACLVTVMVFALAGCSESAFSFTQVGDKLTIEAKDAADAHEAEYEAIEVGDNCVVNITSALDKGELKIEFYEAINTKTDEEEDDNYVLGDVAATVNVGPDSVESVPLPYGDYVLEITAVGETNGKVDLVIEKQK